MLGENRENGNSSGEDLRMRAVLHLFLLGALFSMVSNSLDTKRSLRGVREKLSVSGPKEEVRTAQDARKKDTNKVTKEKKKKIKFAKNKRRKTEKKTKKNKKNNRTIKLKNSKKATKKKKSTERQCPQSTPVSDQCMKVYKGC